MSLLHVCYIQLLDKGLVTNVDHVYPYRREVITKELDSLYTSFLEIVECFFFPLPSPQWFYRDSNASHLAVDSSVLASDRSFANYPRIK